MDQKMDPHIMQRKDHAEFIDHTLLAPEYMRDGNHAWIQMDLINFPKPPTNDNVETLQTDLHYNTLFTETSGHHSVEEEHKVTSDVYIPMNSDFLIQKPFNNPVDEVGSVEKVVLLSESNVALSVATVDDDCDITRFRKVLPHKKRISRKLKINHERTDLPMDEQKIQNVEYRCELCGHVTCSQMEFFAHLKQHYEPSTPDTILAVMKTSLDVLGPEKTDDSAELCAIGKKTDGLDQVFFPFGGFPQNNDDVRMVIPHHSAVEPAELNMIETTLEETINGSTNLQSQQTPSNSSDQQSLATEEFSDTEDMLEGIRDKVLIENSCDTMDLMTPTLNGARPHWFTNNCFNNIDLKSKQFCDVLFPGQFTPLTTSIQQNHSDDVHVIISNSSNDNTTQYQAPIRHQLPKLIPAIMKFNPAGEMITLPSQDPPPLTLAKHLQYDQFRTLATSLDPSITAQTLLNHETSVQPPDFPINEANHIIPSHHIKVEEVSTTQKPKSPRPFDAEETMSGDEYHNESDEQRELREESINQYKQLKLEAQYKGKHLEYEESVEADKASETTGGRKRYQCNNCHRVFNSCNALKYHYRTHTGQRSHHCDICGKSFFAQGALKAHTRTHTGDKPYECQHCNRKFRQWGDLKYHVISIHSDEKNHQCEFCGKAFSRKYSLVVHLRIHTSERNYKCEFCTRTFRASSYLQNHRKIHTGEKPYECTICSKKFRVSGDLRRHQRIHQRKRNKQNPSKSITPTVAPQTTLAIQVSLS